MKREGSWPCIRISGGQWNPETEKKRAVYEVYRVRAPICGRKSTHGHLWLIHYEKVPRGGLAYFLGVLLIIFGASLLQGASMKMSRKKVRSKMRGFIS